MAFYERFEWLCEDKGVTPTQVARDVGIRQSVVSMWKKRGSTPSGKTLNKLADYFEVSTDYLLGNVIDATKPGSATGVRFITGSGEGNGSERISELIYQPITPFTPENMATMAREQDMITSFRKLNVIGQMEAKKRVEELTEIPRYRRQDTPAVGTPTADTPSSETPTEDG